jgi:hypothetical protein
MAPESSLPFSQQPVTICYLNQINPVHYVPSFYWTCISMWFSHVPLSLTSGLFPLGSPTESSYKLLSVAYYLLRLPNYACFDRVNIWPVALSVCLSRSSLFSFFPPPVTAHLKSKCPPCLPVNCLQTYVIPLRFGTKFRTHTKQLGLKWY